MGSFRRSLICLALLLLSAVDSLILNGKLSSSNTPIIQWAARSKKKSYTCRNDDAYKVIRRREDASSRVVVADGDPDQEGSARFSRALTQVLSQGNGRSLIDDTMVALRQIAARGIAGAATLAAVDAYTHYDERGRKATVLEVLGLGDAEVRIFREQKSRWRPVFVSGKMTTIEGHPWRAGISSKGIVIDPKLIIRAHQCKCSVRPNDVVIVGTRGLFGNLRDSEIVDALESSHESPHVVVPSLIRSARQNWFQPDDITCIAGVVLE